MVPVSQVTFKDAFAGNHGSSEKTVNAMLTSEDHNRITKTDHLLVAMPQTLVSNLVKQKLRSVVFQNDIFCKIECVPFPPLYVTNMRQTKLDNQDFIANVTVGVKKESKEAADVRSKKELRRPNFAKSAQSSRA